MARIRTIKPEFWTSEQIVECSTTARLLFVGMWNFADDGGNLPASFKTVKMQIFPADNIDVEPLISELFSVGLLVEYCVNGRNYWHITGWHHQKIDKPTYKYPRFNDTNIVEHSSNTRREVVDASATEGKGREGIGRGKDISSSLRSEDTRARRAVAVNRFDEFWQAWPNKVGKPVALKAYAKVSSEHDAIMEGLAAYIKNKPADRSWLNPSTFLNQRRWEDRPASVSAPVREGKGDWSANLMKEIERRLDDEQSEQSPTIAETVELLSFDGKSWA